ncbi:MAG TPA: hypothetical protein VHN38_10360, partial [Immundisolibacter sp.]|nr:hypothetical protein [Immundisolibacter sp.]
MPPATTMNIDRRPTLMRHKHPDETRRRLMGGAAAAGLLAGVDALLPAWARSPVMQIAGVGRSVAGPVEFDLNVARQRIDIAGKSAWA